MHRNVESLKELPNNEILVDGKQLKYNLKFSRYNYFNTTVKKEYYDYYGNEFYTRNGNIIYVNNNILMDHFLLKIKNNKVSEIKNLEEEFNTYDYFTKHLTNELSNKKISIIENEDGSKSIKADGKDVIKLRNSAIEELKMETPKEIEGLFLFYNIHLKKISLPNTEKIGPTSFYKNKDLEEFNVPKAKVFGYDILYLNNKLKVLNLPNTTTIIGILNNNKVLEEINAPKLKTLTNASFLTQDIKLEKINLPSLEKVSIYDMELLTRLKPVIGTYLKETIEKNLTKKEMLQEQHTR